MERRFLITADWHLDNYINLGLADSEQLTPQIRFIEKAIYEIKDYATENGIDTLIIAGDLVHRRNIRQDSVNNILTKIFKEIELAGITTHIVVGNHDQSTQGGKVNAVTRLASSKTFVYSEPTLVTILGIEFVTAPFQEHRKIIDSLNELRKDFSQLPHIFVGHIGIDGCKVGSLEKKMLEPVSLNELNPSEYIFGYLGHYHHSQQIGDNFLYTGAICQHCYGDSGNERGFWDVEIVKEPNGWKAVNTFIPINSTPKFYETPVEDFVPTNYRPIDYIKVTGVSAVQRVELQEKYPSIVVEGESIATADDEIIISMGDTGEEWVKVWVDETMTNRRKRRSLVKLGNEILNRVGE